MPGELKATVTAAGEGLQVELPRAAGLRAGELTAVGHGTDALLLLKDGLSQAGYLAGSLQSMAIAEIFSHVISGIRTGRLVVSVKGARKTVSFKDAQIVFASSTEPHERFGRKLVRMGVIRQDQLDAALLAVKPGAKLGQVLRKNGWVKASALYAAMTELVREIVLNLFELTDGHFIFLEGQSPGEDAVKLSGKVRDLVLEGVKRAEATHLWRARLPSHLRLLVTGEAETPEEHILFPLIGDGAPVGSLQDRFAGSDFAFLGCISGALAKGALAVETGKPAPEPQARPAPAGARSPLERYGALIHTICQALLDAGQTLADLESFLSDPLPGMEQAFAGVTLGADGRMDLPRVMQNATRADARLGRVKAYEALEAFVSYALFSAKNALPPELAESLNREFRGLQDGQ